VSLSFANAAERAGVATPAQAYTVRWGRFDNATGTTTMVGSASESPAMTAVAPAALLAEARDGDFVEAAISVRHPDHPAWATPVIAHFRRADARWTLVGLKRLPNGAR
jgi:hypothetical protein